MSAPREYSDMPEGRAVAALFIGDGHPACDRYIRSRGCLLNVEIESREQSKAKNIKYEKNLCQ